MASKKALTQVKDIREGKDEALKAALAQIQKEFGQGSIMTLGDDRKRMNIETISTGSISLDLATGIGGIAKGRIAEIYGPESSGKTTLTLHIIAEAQKNGGKAAFIDAEHALDPEYAENLGVNIDELIVSQPDTGEQALEICEMLVRSGALDVVVIDSVAALVPKAEIEGAMGDSVVGLQARLMSQALRKLAAIINKSNTSVIFINQLREKIGIMYGSPEVTTGGKALKFYASMRFDVRRVETIKKGDEMLGNRVKVKIVKNKLAPPFKQAEFEIMYGEGISKMGDIIDSAINVNIIDKSGSWYSFKGTRLGQGKENVKAFLKENPKLADTIEGLLLDTLHGDDNLEENENQKNDSPEKSVEQLFEIDEDGVVLD
ncbi:MAG: recombinase RecA [[Eubacterium] brachy]|nr:RecA protein [Eubacterium brachy ATCC 33089]MBF1133670.1 recombinase RecA [[Eubacterium] brachy]